MPPSSQYWSLLLEGWRKTLPVHLILQLIAPEPRTPFWSLLDFSLLPYYCQHEEVIIRGTYQDAILITQLLSSLTNLLHSIIFLFMICYLLLLEWTLKKLLLHDDLKQLMKQLRKNGQKTKNTAGGTLCLDGGQLPQESSTKCFTLLFC